jgi:hypothetical protein
MPEARGQNHDVVVTGLFFVSAKRATEHGAHTEHVEERRGDVDAAHLLRIGVAFVWACHREPPISPGNHMVEETGFAAPINEVS